MFVIHICGKKILSRIFKELLKINKKKRLQEINRMVGIWVEFLGTVAAKLAANSEGPSKAAVGDPSVQYRCLILNSPGRQSTAASTSRQGGGDQQ